MTVKSMKKVMNNYKLHIVHSVISAIYSVCNNVTDLCNLSCPNNLFPSVHALHKCGQSD